MAEIVIFREKHGDRHYDLQANGGWSRICMALFRERDAQDYYGFKTEEPDLPEKPVPPEDMENAKALAQYASELATWQRKRDWVKDRMDEKEFILLAREGNLTAARTVIELRCAHQYEGYTFVKLQKVPEDIPHWAHHPEKRIRELAHGIQALLDMGFTDLTGKDVELSLLWVRETRNRPWDSIPLQPPTREQEDMILTLTSHLDRLISHPGSLKIEDSARRYTTRVGLCSGAALTHRRCREYGSVEAVLDARMESRFPPGSRADKRVSDREKQSYREGLREELLGYLEPQES